MASSVKASANFAKQDAGGGIEVSWTISSKRIKFFIEKHRKFTNHVGVDMRRFCRSLLIIACMVTVQKPAVSQESSEALVASLIELSHFDQTMDQITQAMSAAMMQAFNELIDEENANLSEELRNEFHAILEDELTSSSQQMMGPLKNFMTEFYVDRFTQEELTALVEMYGSQVYQKQFAYMPELMQQAAALATEHQNATRDRLNERLADWAKKVEQQQ